VEANMALSGKCPKCERIVTHLELETPKIKQGSQDVFVGVTYLCPRCKTILGAGIDPVALKADTVSGIVTALKARWTP
jgi:phage FluMu protein Com